MWRQRTSGRPPVANRNCPNYPNVKPHIRNHPTFRELRDTLIIAIHQAILPLPLLATPEYSRYLTEHVTGYTLGWQIFRVAAETNYLLYHGCGTKTVVVQLFLACSMSSVLLCVLRRQLWLRWREQICIGMNCAYGVVTFLKVFRLVPRLPNETHYLFKHCLLSMADAFFCQVPVHKFYLAQALDASLRCIVWRRYHVLPGAPTPLVVLVSLTWQAWIVVFSCMLQARHVTAYQRCHPLQAQPQPPLRLASAATTEKGVKAEVKAALPHGSPGSSFAAAAATARSEAGVGEGLRAPALELPSTAPSPIQEQQQQQPGEEQQQLQQQPSPIHRSTEPRLPGVFSGSTTFTTTTNTGSELGPETSSPGMLQASDLLFSRFSSSSTRTRSGLSSGTCPAYRVVTYGGADVGISLTASLEEARKGEGYEPPLSSGDERGRTVYSPGVGSIREGMRECAKGSADSRGARGSAVRSQRELRIADKESEDEDNDDDDDFKVPIPMLSIVESSGASSGHLLTHDDETRPPVHQGVEEANGHFGWRPEGAAVVTTDAVRPASLTHFPGLTAAGLFGAGGSSTPRYRSSRQATSDDHLPLGATAATAAAPDTGIPVQSKATATTMPLSSGSPSSSEMSSMPTRSPGHGSNRRSRHAEATLRRFMQGPSSYVLLSKQRECDQNACATASVQIVVSSAHPHQLMAQWRDKVAAVVSESATGWHIANASVRKGSLIVHLDLVYHHPTASQAAPFAAEAASGAAAAFTAAPHGNGSCSGSSNHLIGNSTMSPVAPALAEPAREGSFLSSGAASTSPPRPQSQLTATEALERLFLSLGPSGILDTLSLPEHTPAGAEDFISVQHGNMILRYGCDAMPGRYSAADVPSASWSVGEIEPVPPIESSGTTAWESSTLGRCGGSTIPPRLRRRRGAGQSMVASLQARQRGDAATPAAAAATQQSRVAEDSGDLRRRLLGMGRSMDGAPPQDAIPSLSSARRRAMDLYDHVLMALRPPLLVANRDYAAFLHTRVARLHIAYANLMAATMLVFYASHHGSGLRLANILSFMAPEVLTVTARAVAGGCFWAAVRVPLLHVGVVLRGVQMISTCLGIMPRVSQADDCSEMRWIMKMMVISALQVFCMQTPVRLTFIVRLVPLVGGIMSHLLLCHPDGSLLGGLALHIGWEAALFLLAASMEARHIAAYYRHRLSSAGASTASLSPSAPLSPTASCFSSTDAVSVINAKTAGTTFGDVQSFKSLSSAALAATAAATAAGTNSSDGGHASTFASFLSAPPSEKSPPTPLSFSAVDLGGDTSPSTELLWSSVTKWENVAMTTGVGMGAREADPWDIILNGCVLAMAPRCTSSLHLSFTCTARVVEQLEVVLRHISPASMASGLHIASPAAVITRTLAPPAAAHVQQPPGTALRFDAELIMVAAPQDMPGVVHVELWRGHQRLAGRPVLLALAVATIAPPEALGGRSWGGGAQADTAAGGDTAAGLAEGELPPWLRDVAAYVEAVTAEGHGPAADQFVEELGGWLAQLAALQRGLTASASGAGPQSAGSAAAQRISRILRVHSAGWAPHPELGSRLGTASGNSRLAQHRQVPSNSGGARVAPPSALAEAAETVHDALAKGPSSLDPTSAVIRQLLLCQGQGFLAVAVEAGCQALSEHLLVLLLGPLGSGLGTVLEAAVTPVTGLPLMHAAVKSGCTEMVDLVAGWQARAGVSDIWSREAVVRAISLEPRIPGCELRAGASAATHLMGPCLVATAAPGDPTQPPGARSTATAVAVAPSPPPNHHHHHQQQRLFLTNFDSVLDSAAAAAPEGGRGEETSGLVFPIRLSDKHHDNDLSLTGSFLLEAGLRQSSPPSVNNMLPALLALASVTPCPVPSPGAPHPAPKGAPPMPCASPTTPSHPSGPGTASPSSTPHALADAHGTAYTSTGVSMMAAAAASALAPPPGQQLAMELSAPFKVICLRPETTCGSSAVQVLPRNAHDAKEPLGAGALLPHVLHDLRLMSVLHGGANDISAVTSQAFPKAAPQAGMLDMELGRLQGLSVAPVVGGGAGDAGQQRSSLESQCTFMDGGVLLVTPLHLALALGDEGRVAAHILSKYHEAHEMWSASQAQWMATGASNAVSAMDSCTMQSPFEMLPAYTVGAGPASSSCAGFTGPLIPSGIALRRGSSLINATATSAAMPSHASHARYRISGIGGSVTMAANGAGIGGGERTTPRGWLRMSGRALCGLGEGGHGCGGGGGGIMSSPPLGVIKDVGPEEEAIQSLSLAKLAFMEALRRTVHSNPASAVENKGCTGGISQQP